MLHSLLDGFLDFLSRVSKHIVIMHIVICLASAVRPKHHERHRQYTQQMYSTVRATATEMK